MARSREEIEQEAVVEYCRYRRIPVYHVPNESKRSPAYGARLKRIGMSAGVPDLVIPVPNSEYHGLFIEMKAGKNKATQAQREWISLLNQNGYRAVICYGAEKACEEIDRYFSTNPERA